VITQALNRVGLRMLFLFGNLFRQDMHQPENSDANIGAITSTTIWPDESVDPGRAWGVAPLLWAQW